jgi:hypothetical protein
VIFQQLGESSRFKVAIGELPHHSWPLSFATWQWLEREGAMSTVIDFPHRNNFNRHQLWNRFERANVFEHYLD